MRTFLNETGMSGQVRIKVCGITSAADAMAAADAGVDAIGLNFYPASPRFVTIDAATAILAALPPLVHPVGVVVEERPEEAAARRRQLPGLRSVQWHGADPELAMAWTMPLVVAFPVRDADSLATITRYLERCRVSGRMPAAILVDAHVPGQHGGTGQRPPWDLLADFRPEVPVILAGGLTPDNVAEAVRFVRPYAVDVASGVESAPGRKDADAMRRFVDNARRHDN
jgi:phosphoribosylanthranilate isomerase